MEEIEQTAQEVAELINDGDLPLAVRVSGEALARADNRWRKAYNSRQPRTERLEIIDKVVTAGQLHADVLLRAGQPAEAFGVGMAVMMCMSYEDCAAEMPRQAAVLLYLSVNAFQEAVKDMPQDEFTTSHVQPVAVYLLSMLYAFYQASPHKGGEVYHHIHALLSSCLNSGMIQSPHVPTPDGPCDPLHPAHIVGDIIGHASALGLLGEQSA